MATWTDSYMRTATVASSAKTQVGTDINVASGESIVILGMFGGHPQGGSMGYGVDRLPGINANFPQSSAAAVTALEAIAPGSQNSLNTVVSGPAVVSLFTVNAAATSGVARLWLKVQRTAAGSN